MIAGGEDVGVPTVPGKRHRDNPALRRVRMIAEPDTRHTFEQATTFNGLVDEFPWRASAQGKIASTVAFRACVWGISRTR